jgi:hypothetical protein
MVYNILQAKDSTLGGCSLSCDRGKHDHMIKANPSLTNVVNRMCATLRLHDISQSTCIDGELGSALLDQVIIIRGERCT